MIEARDYAEYPNMIDLKDKKNQYAIDDLKDQGAFGQFMLKLLDHAREENKSLEIEGFGTQQYNVFYDNDRIFFTIDVYVGEGGAAVEGIGMSTNIEFLKKPWVKRVMDEMPDKQWVKMHPPGFAPLYQEVTGRKMITMAELKSRYSGLRNIEIKDVIKAVLAPLAAYFKIKDVPNSYIFELQFINKEMRQKYLDDDPAFYAAMKPIFDEVVPRIYQELDKLSESKMK